jgi:pentose-5-phosphate-3-epimerase
MVIEKESYLAQLLKKKADILRIQKETGKNVSSMIGDVGKLNKP